MKKLNLLLFVTLITLSLMPQSELISMEQPTNQSIEYKNANLRIVNGRTQMRVPNPVLNDDGTTTIEYEWRNTSRIPACPTSKKTTEK